MGFIFDIVKGIIREKQIEKEKSDIYEDYEKSLNSWDYKGWEDYFRSSLEKLNKERLDIHKDRKNLTDLTNIRKNKFLEKIREIVEDEDLEKYEKRHTLRELVDSYKDIYNDFFILDSLKNGQWFILETVDNDFKKEYLIKSFAAYANGYNAEVDRNIKSPAYNEFYTKLMEGAIVDETPFVRITNGNAYDYFPENLFSDKDFIRNSLAIFPDLIRKAPLEVQNDVDFIKSLVRKSLESSSYTFKNIPTNYFSDVTFIEDIVKDVPSFVSCIDYKLQKNESFVSSLMDINPRIIFSLDSSCVTGDLMLKFLDMNETVLDNYTHSHPGVLFKNIEYNFYELLRTDDNFALEIIDRGYLEHFSNINLALIDDNVMNALLDKFQEFEAGKGFNLNEYREEHNMFIGVLRSIDFQEQRCLLIEKVESNRSPIEYDSEENDNAMEL